MGLSTFDTFKRTSGGEGTIEMSGERLKSLQAVLAGMLQDINDFCLRNEIPYTLGGGTCLGAIRHHGFIPWDDDVDINMTREGYRRFSKLFLKEYGEKYWLHDCDRTPGYDLAFPRVRLKDTVVRNRDDRDNSECGACVDIFIIENAPSNTMLRSLHGFGSMALGLLYSCRRFAAHANEHLDLVKDDSEATGAFKKKILIGKLLSFRSVEAWTRTWDRWNSMCGNENSSHVVIPVGRKHYFGELYERESYFPVSHGEFEDVEAPVPADANAYMTALYGSSYMELPPVADREKHVVYEFDLGKYGAKARAASGRDGLDENR